MLLVSLPLLALLQAPGADAAAALVPADAAILVRFESLASVAELANAFRELEAGEPLTPARLLASLPYPGPAENVDPTRALYLAVALAPDQPAPSMTWIVPTRAGVALGIDDSEGTLSIHAAGDYVAVTDRPGVARPSTPSLLVATLAPGLVALHLDLATLVARFKPLLDTGLRQAELALEGLPDDGSTPFDAAAFFEWYFELARDTLASAEAVEFALARQGETLTLRGCYRVKPASPQVFPAYETVPLAPLAGLVDPEHPLEMVTNASPRDLASLFEDLMDVAVEAYPEPLRSDLARAFELQRGLADLFLPGVAVGTDFTTEGLHGYYVLRSKDAARALSGLEEMMRAFDHGDGLLAIGAAERLAVAGFEGRVLPLEFRAEAFRRLLSVVGEAEPPADLGREVEEMIATLYGRNLRLALAGRGELVAVVLANNDSLVRADLERLAHPALPAAKMQALTDEVPPGAFGVVQHIDFGQTTGRMLAAMRGVVELPYGVFPELDFSLDVWGAALDRDYTGGARMDLAELRAFVRALQEYDGK